MDTYIQQLTLGIEIIKQNLPFVLMLMFILWAIHLVNWLLGNRLKVLGIYPRKWYSLPGIFLYPFIHSNFNHLFFNSIPLFILINFILLSGYQTFYYVSFIIITLSGLGIWLFARKGYHIGASGLIMGYWSYLLISAYYDHTSVFTIAPAIVCLYYFGGFLFQLFPTDIKTSFEAHFFGFVAGIAAYYI